MRFPIERGAVISFARSVGDPNPIYYGDATESSDADGLIPPTFAIASAQFDPAFPFRPRIGEPTTAPLTPPHLEARSPGLHAEQHFEYRRHVRVGEVLTFTSRVARRWTKTNAQGNTLYFQESLTEYVDEDGDVVLVASSVIVHLTDDGF